MKNLSIRTLWVYCLIVSITLLVSFLSFWFPSFISHYQFVIIIFLLVFIGIPHGATDHLVFNYLNKSKILIACTLKFYVFYLGYILAYSICWYLFPSWSLVTFILISIYHLGQSNLYYLSLPQNKIINTFVYCSWGLFVVFTPILSNFEEVTAILESLIGRKWTIPFENQEYFLALVIILNFLVVSTLFILRYVNTKQLIREYLNLLVLALLFRTAPLLLSFGVYFGLWHSLSSTFDQMSLIKRYYDVKFNFIDFYLHSILFSLVPILFFSVSYLFIFKFSFKYSEENFNSIISLFFVGLATITLPHALIRDKFYKKVIYNT